MRARAKTRILFAVSLAAGLLLGAAIVLCAGFYNIAATHQHFKPTFWLLKLAMRESVKRHAPHIDPALLADPALETRGLAVYDAHCVQCHGAPGIAPRPFALGLTPTPTNLADSVRRREPGDLFW